MEPRTVITPLREAILTLGFMYRPLLHLQLPDNGTPAVFDMHYV